MEKKTYLVTYKAEVTRSATVEANSESEAMNAFRDGQFRDALDIDDDHYEVLSVTEYR